jgi:hypothetical protein
MHHGGLFTMSVHLDGNGRVSDRTFHPGETAMTQVSENEEREHLATEELKNAHAALAMGAGVGAVGTISAVLIGATCPICVVMAPALIGMGLVKGYAAKRKLKSESEFQITPPPDLDERQMAIY